MRKPTRAKATKANQNFLLTNKKENDIISLQDKEREKIMFRTQAQLTAQ